jgi:hypothetical protein
MNTALARWIVVDRLDKKVVLWMMVAPAAAWSSARLPPSMTKT